MNNRVLVFSIALVGYDRLFESCIETQRQYCRNCSYQYVLVDHAPRRLRPIEAAWLKIPLIISALKAGYEWVAFIDADCDVRNNMPCFPEYFDSLELEKSIFLSPGFSGRVNSGVIFIKNSAASVEFFQSVINHADQDVPQEDRTDYENGHIIFFGKNSPDVYLLEHNLWNNNSKLDDESYIQHYSGGMLRQWFLNNRAPSEFQSKTKGQIHKVIKTVARKFRNLTISSPDQEPSISASINELMPFYERKFPAFSNGHTSA